MTKIVINACYGGFSLSAKAVQELYSLGTPGVNAYAAEEHYRSQPGELAKDLAKYRAGDAWYVFSPCERFVLYAGEVPRDNSDLINVVERLGADASSQYAKLKIVEIPDGVDWEINEYDGYESVEEKHRSWG